MMKTFDSKSLIERRITLVLQYALDDVLCELPEIRADQPIREIVNDLNDVMFLFDTMHDCFIRHRTVRLNKKELLSEMMLLWERGTFRELFDLIENRYDLVSIESINLLGSPCLTAGVFRTCERIVEQVAPNTPRIAPSTPIYPRLKGRAIRAFMAELYLATGGKADFWRDIRRVDAITSVLTLLSVPIVLVALSTVIFQLPRDLSPILVGIVGSAVLMLGGATICLGLQAAYRSVLERTIGVLPTKNYSFRDLAYEVEKAIQQ